MIEGLDCANCAAKIEKRLNTLEGVDECTITFASKQLRLTAKNPDALIPAVKQAIDAMADGITIVAKDEKKKDEDSDDPKKELTGRPPAGPADRAGACLPDSGRRGGLERPEEHCQGPGV